MSTARRGRQEPPNFSFPLVQTAALTALATTSPLPTKVVTISAPAGYGKTVLQTALFRHVRGLDVRAIWVGLDERDTTMDRVLSSLEGALVKEQSELDPTSAVHQSDEPVDARIDALIDSICALRGPTVLFVDNLSYCEDDTLHVLLDALALNTPDDLYLVLAGGGEPPMGLARLKLQGRLTSISFAELAMRESEVRSLLGEDLCERLGDDGVASIMRQSEGWPAAVRLMQIVLGTAPQPKAALAAFSGSDVDLAEMLNRQVLAGFTPALRQFLIETSHLRSFCVALCRHVTGDDHADEYVSHLLRHNVFIIPLDRNRTWYRLHGLFREFLAAEAERSLTVQRRQEVLLRAAEWCEQNGLWADAIDYALSAQAYDTAAGILERVAPCFVRDRGDLRKFIGWVEELKRVGASVQWETEFWYVWALVFHRRYEYVRQQLEPLAARVAAAESRQPDTRTAAMQRRIEIIRTAVATYVDRLDEAEALGKRWLSQRGNDDPFDVATISCAVSLGRTARFDFAGAREYAGIAQPSIGQARSDYGELWVSTVSSLIIMQEGDFGLAYDTLKSTLEHARGSLGDSAGITGTIAFLAARSAVETGEDAIARQWLDLGMRRAQNHGLVDTAAHGLEAAIKLWASPLGRGIELAQLREIAASYPARLGIMFACFVIQRLLRLGRLDDALLEAAKLGLSGSGDIEAADAQLPVVRFLLAQTQIGLDIAGGRLRQAENRIGEASKHARAEGRWGHLVELTLDEMAVSLCTKNPAPAARHLTRAVTFAAKRRYLRPFRDRAEMIAGLVNQTKPQSWGFALDEERGFFGEICRLLPIANSQLVEQLERLDVEPKMLENPTPRELELLSLIEAGLSNQQLADRLSVSVATVKWHLWNLYAKLGVSSRAAAVAKARALNLLSR